MIVLDTHIWVWWVSGSAELSHGKTQMLESRQADGFGISAISCWEISKLVEKGRLSLTMPVGQWIDQALAHAGIFRRGKPLKRLESATASWTPG